MRNILKKLLVFALLVSMCMCKNVNVASASEQKSFVYTEEFFEVKYTVNGEWDKNYYNVSFEIKNISDEVIENWFLGMSIDGSIEQIWDATIYSHEVDHYVIKNATYNSNIAPGETIGFGCILKLNEKEAFPQEFYMPVKTEAVKEERYALQIESVDSWENRTNYKITIENISMQTIEDWSVEFDLNGEIESFWDCKLVSREGMRYRLSNSDYNRIIKQGESVSFHVIVESNVKQEPEEVVLYEITSDGIKIAEKLVNAEYFEEFEIVTDLYEVMPLYTTDGRISAYMVQYYNDNNEPTGYVVVSNEVGCLNYYIEFGIGRANMIERVINAVEDGYKEEVERVIYAGGYTYYVAVGFLRTERKDSPNVPRIIDYRTMSEAKNACLPEMITNHCGPTAGLNVLIYLSKLGYQTLPIDDNGWKQKKD